MNSNRSFPATGRFTCPCCPRVFNHRRGVGTHLGRKHADYGGVQQYVLEVQLKGVHPVCLCGCGELVAWHKTQYRYVDYVSGHNEVEDKYVFSPEDRSKAHETYRQRLADPEEREYLLRVNSKSVTEAFKDPQKKQNLHDGQIRGWDASTEQGKRRRKKRREDNVIMWQDPDHYDKVFTEDMRRAVGIANMLRDQKRGSKEEDEFYEHLCSVLGADDVKHDCWINDPELGTGCYDVYIRSARCRVEYDGIAHHGLDRDSDWTQYQLDNMKNDERKNEMIRRRPGARLLRVRSDSDWRSIRSFADLERVAYADVRSNKHKRNDDVACDKEAHEFGRVA